MERMIKIAICDDNREELIKIRSHCMAYIAKHPEHDVRISMFEDSCVLLSQIERKNIFDIMLLDVYMPDITGVDLARALREGDDACEIIFLTTSVTHAVEAFALHATHYIVKPYTQAQFQSALDKAFSQLAKRKKAKIAIKSSMGVHTILFEDFLYAETERHMQHIHLTDGKSFRTRMSSIELYESLAQDERFYKYGSTYIINLGKIREITDRTIVLDTNDQLHMQRRQFRPLIDRYTQYSLKGER